MSLSFFLFLGLVFVAVLLQLLMLCCCRTRTLCTWEHFLMLSASLGSLLPCTAHCLFIIWAKCTCTITTSLAGYVYIIITWYQNQIWISSIFSFSNTFWAFGHKLIADSPRFQWLWVVHFDLCHKEIFLNPFGRWTGSLLSSRLGSTSVLFAAAPCIFLLADSTGWMMFVWVCRLSQISTCSTWMM